MGTHCLISSRKILAACCGIVLASGILAYRAQADPWDKKTVLTVNKTFQVEDKVLPAGTYVFKLLDSSSNRHVVQIFNEDQSRILDTVMAIPNYRMQPTGHSRFLFYETPTGAAPALHAWFYPGDNFGQEFRYPKHLAMLQTVQQTESTRITKQNEETKTESTVERQEPAPAPVEPEQAAAPEQTQRQEQPVEIAQSTPPPAPAAPAAEPPTPAQTPSELPKTASPFPMVGLAGMLSLAIYGLLRLKSLA